MLRRILPCLAALTLALASVAVWAASPASSGGAPAITVDTTVDDAALDDCTGAPDDCSLRGAVETFAQAQDMGVTTDITVPAGEYLLQDELHVHELNVNVHGAGVDNTLVGIDRTTDDSLIRHLYLHGGEGEITAVLSDMTFAGGNGDQETNQGGSILASGGVHLTLLRMHFNENEIRGDGGAVAFYGNPSNQTLFIEDSTFAGNRATELGGAIHVAAGEEAFISNSTFTQNQAAFGGALYVGQFESTDTATAQLTHVTLADNAASGFQGDPAGAAVGVGNESEVRLEGTVIERSVEGEGFAPTAVGDTVDNCWVADGGTLESAGHNVADDDTCGLTEDTDQPDTAADTQALADNGGPTSTMALLADSAAVDTAGATCDVSDDQRGIARPQDGNADDTVACDAGAYERSADPEEEPPPAARPATVVPTFTG